MWLNCDLQIVNDTRAQHFVYICTFCFHKVLYISYIYYYDNIIIHNRERDSLFILFVTQMLYKLLTFCLSVYFCASYAEKGIFLLNAKLYKTTKQILLDSLLQDTEWIEYYFFNRIIFKSSNSVIFLEWLKNILSL